MDSSEAYALDSLIYTRAENIYWNTDTREMRDPMLLEVEEKLRISISFSVFTMQLVLCTSEQAPEQYGKERIADAITIRHQQDEPSVEEEEPYLKPILASVPFHRRGKVFYRRVDSIVSTKRLVIRREHNTILARLIGAYSIIRV